MEGWREFLSEDENRKTPILTAAPDTEECSKFKNMYIGCAKYGSEQFPRAYFPIDWKHRVAEIKWARRQNPQWSRELGPITASVDWALLELHRYMMTDYGPTGSDVRQIPQMFIGRISAWTRRIARLDPKWQYAKETEKQRWKNAGKDFIAAMRDEMK